MISRPVMLYLPRGPGVFGAAFQLFVLLDLHGRLSSSVLLADVLLEGACLTESSYGKPHSLKKEPIKGFSGNNSCNAVES